MRRTLIELLESEDEADQALKLFLAHLMSKGFGKHQHGTLRNFLLRGIRSAAKTRLAQTAPERQLDLDYLTFDSVDWLKTWRSGLIERAWRSLERIEHQSPDRPLFAVLHAATANPRDTSDMLAIRLATESNVTITPNEVEELLPVSRETFAQLIADEVAETLDIPSKPEVHAEIQDLGLAGILANLVVAE